MENMEGLKGEKILITGGTGFIGGHLVKSLLKDGASIIVVDIKIKKKSFFELNDLKKKVKLELIDISDKEKVFNIIKKCKPKYIVHLAAQTLVTNSYKNPWETFNTNIMGTVNILEAMRLLKIVKGIVVASSDKAYGKTEKAYIESSPLKGDHPYDVSKSSADLITQAYYKTYNIPVVITRFGNVYGEGDLHFDRIIPGICKAVIKKNVLEIRSNGKYVRDYVYVKDVIDGYLTILKNIDSVYGEAYNFSSKNTFSVLELIKESEKILNIEIPYRIVNSVKNEIPYQHLNDWKVRELGWGNKYSVKSTLPGIIDWYRRVV